MQGIFYLLLQCFTSLITPHFAYLHSNKVDVYSIGIIFYKMIFGKVPWGELQRHEFILNQKKLNGKIPFPLDYVVSKAGRDFIDNCLIFDTERRLDLDRISCHCYLSVDLNISAQQIGKNDTLEESFTKLDINGGVSLYMFFIVVYHHC